MSMCLCVCIYRHTYDAWSLCLFVKERSIAPSVTRNRKVQLGFGLCKILFHFEAHVHESTILAPPPGPLALPTLVQYLCTIGGVYDSPSELPCVCYTPYNTGNNNIM